MATLGEVGGGGGQLVDKKICSRRSKFFKSRFHFGRASSAREANRKAKKLSPFLNIVGKKT